MREFARKVNLLMRRNKRKEDKFDVDLAIHTEKYTKFMTNILTKLASDVLAVTNPSSQLWTA